MFALQNASTVTTNASELVKKAKAFIDREVVLIPNGIEPKHFKPMKKNHILAEALGLSHVILSEAKDLHHNDRDSSVASTLPHTVPASLRESDMVPVIGFVGELREKKGLATLLNAYALVNKKQPLHYSSSAKCDRVKI
jgi:glycosyltransferase involved in cell wall biosynthesis